MPTPDGTGLSERSDGSEGSVDGGGVTTPAPAQTRRLRLDLAYDGTAYSGWAEQPGRRTIAAAVRHALETLARGPVRLTVAGRTDAGVHAKGQVAHADVPAAAVAGIDLARLNGLLPKDIRMTALATASAGFDARFSALSRRYAYRVTDVVPDPLRRHDTLAWPHRLDLARMRQAAAPLLGLQDFAAFCRRRQGATTVRTLERLEWTRADPDVLVAEVMADAFCHSMVRSLIGALLTVGDGRADIGWPAQLMMQRVRADTVMVAPAHGLTLLEVFYPPPEELARRAELTRARRVPSD